MSKASGFHFCINAKEVTVPPIVFGGDGVVGSIDGIANGTTLYHEATIWEHRRFTTQV